MVAFPVPLLFLEPLRASCRVRSSLSLVFIIFKQIFHMTTTSPMPLYPPPPLGMSTIVVRADASGMCPSRNAYFFTLASLSQCPLSGYIPLVSSLINVLKFYDAMTNGPPTHTFCSLCTATAISSPSGGSSVILTGCTSIRISRHPAGTACRYPPSGLRCVPVPLWWGVLSVHWPLSNTYVFCSTLTLSGHLRLVYQYSTPLSSPCVSCPPSVLLGTV